MLDTHKSQDDMELSFVKECLIDELGLELGVDFSFSAEELLLNKKAFLKLITAAPDCESRNFFLSVTIVN
jgi:hypothetical protein